MLESELVVFSLIVTSIDGVKGLMKFLQSIEKQSVSGFEVEIIFVDQSVGLFDSVLEEFPMLKILSVRTGRCSLSAARNLGMKHATGSIFAFPDDDCTYYPDTLQRAFDILVCQPVSALVGRIYDRATGRAILKAWPEARKMLARYEAFRYASSITIFTKMYIEFDARMGLGAEFGSCEDVDALYSIISEGTVAYEPGVEVWHPDYSLESSTIEKALGYGRGFGFFHRKHFDWFWALYFIAGCGYTCIKFFTALLRFDFQGARVRAHSLSGRILGLFGIIKS